MNRLPVDPAEEEDIVKNQYPDPDEDSPLANKLAEIYHEQIEALKADNRTNLQQHMISLAPKDHYTKVAGAPRASVLSGL